MRAYSRVDVQDVRDTFLVERCAEAARYKYPLSVMTVGIIRRPAPESANCDSGSRDPTSQYLFHLERLSTKRFYPTCCAYPIICAHQVSNYCQPAVNFIMSLNHYGYKEKIITVTFLSWERTNPCFNIYRLVCSTRHEDHVGSMYITCMRREFSWILHLDLRE